MCHDREAAYIRRSLPCNPYLPGYLPLDVSKESRGFAISALSEHKDLAFEVLDFAVSGPGRILDLMGTEGKDYTVEIPTHLLPMCLSDRRPDRTSH